MMIQPNPTTEAIPDARQLQLRLVSLEFEVQETRKELANILADAGVRVEPLSRVAEPFSLIQVTERMRQFTQALTSAKLTVEVTTDPEFGDQKVHFTADQTGSVADTVRLDERWHREMIPIAGPYRQFFTFCAVPSV